MRIELYQDLPGFHAEPAEARYVWVYRVHPDPSAVKPRLVVYLDEHRLETRPTARHKWRRFGRYEGWRYRTHNGMIHHAGFRKPAAEVPVPENLEARIKGALLAAVELKGAFDPPDRRQ